MMRRRASPERSLTDAPPVTPMNHASHSARRLVATACLFVAWTGTAGAAEPLRWRWAEGDATRYQLTQTMRMAIDAGEAGRVDSSRREDKVLRWTAESVDADGAAQIRQTTERVVMQATDSSGDGYRYDSASDEQPVGLAAIIAPLFEALLANDVRMTLRPNGEVTGVVIPPELVEAIERLPGGALSEESVVEAAKQGALRLPEGPLEVGDEWTAEVDVPTPQMGTLRVATTYRYDGPREIDGRTLEAFTPTVRVAPADGDDPSSLQIEPVGSSGEVLFDRASGRVVRSLVEQTMDVTIRALGRDVTGRVERSLRLRQLADGESPDFGQPSEASP